MKTTLLTLLAAILFCSAVFAIDPNVSLANATESEIIQTAQVDAKEYYFNHKNQGPTISDWLPYSEGRAIKHSLYGYPKSAWYTVSFNYVLTQLTQDKE